MNKFAKLFELGNNQVLLIKEYEEEEDIFQVSQTTWIDNVSYSIKLSMKSEVSRNKYFEKYNEEDAKHFLKNIDNLLS